MSIRAMGTAAVLMLAAVCAADAQRPGHRTVELTPSAGYMFFGNYLEGPLGTRLTNANSPLYGVQLDVNLSRTVGVYGHAGLSRSDFQVGLPLVGGVSLASTDVYLYDGGLELRAPIDRTGVPLVPFVQVGAGAIRHEIRTGPINLTSTSPAFNAGVGLDMQFTPSLGLRLLAKDYVARFDFSEATALGIEGKTAHSIGVSVGLKVGF